MMYPIKIALVLSLCLPLMSCTKKQDESGAVIPEASTGATPGAESANAENTEVMDTQGIHAPKGEAVTNPQTDKTHDTDCKPDDEKCLKVKNSSEQNNPE